MKLIRLPPLVAAAAVGKNNVLRTPTRPFTVLWSGSYFEYYDRRRKKIEQITLHNSQSAPTYVQDDVIDSNNRLPIGSKRANDEESTRSDARNQERPSSPNKSRDSEDDTSTVLETEEEEIEEVNDWVARCLSQDIEYEPDDGSVWNDDESVDRSFNAGSDDTIESASASTTDYNGREKSGPGGHERPNDSGQFEIQTETIYTQNVEGWSRVARDADGNADFRADRNYAKLETILDRMEAENIGAYCIQETWMYGDEECVDIGRGFKMWHHNYKDKDYPRDKGTKRVKRGLRRGVAIILNEKFHDAWKLAGSLEPVTSSTTGDHGGRIIGLTLKFPKIDGRGKKIKDSEGRQDYLKIFLLSIYMPALKNKLEKDEVQPHGDFINNELSPILRDAPRNAEIIMGSDINASIGIRVDAEETVLGPNGRDYRGSNKESRARGEDVLNMLMQQKMRVQNTFFTHSSYDTYYHKSDQLPVMYDIIATSQSFHKRVRDCKVVDNGVESDHKAVKISITITSIKYKARAVPRSTILWRRILEDPIYQLVYNTELKKLVDADTDLETFNEKTIEAARIAASFVESKVKGWFEMYGSELRPLIEEKDIICHAIKGETDEVKMREMKVELKQLQKIVNIKCAAAKAHWYRDIAEKIHDMPMDPKKAWECIKLLCGGERLHHKAKKQTMSMKMEDGGLSSTDEEHIGVFGPHFDRVLNNKKEIDFTVLELIKQRETMTELDDPLTRDEFERAVDKLKAGKASGLNGVPPEAFKAMDEELRSLVFGYCVRYWEGEDFRGWQMSQCVPVPKSGDLSNPNKWRGVMLMDVMSKIFSSILNGRIFKIVEAHGSRFQFGGTPKVGCADGLFTIKTLLNMRRNHDLDTYVAFVDLVKAFDTADHKLLIKVLEKYGAPPNLCKVIERMYTDLTVVLKIGKSVEEILQEVGVRQGDNMAPVLFLFLMNAFAESLETIWESKGLERVTVVRASDEDFENGIGSIRRHTKKQYQSPKLEKLTVFQCLYVDDGAFPFISRDQLALGCEVIYDHFARFGLEMHIGRTVNGKTTDSKTECVFFPRPSFLKEKELPVLSNEPSSGLIVESEPAEKPRLSRQEQRKASEEKAKQKAEFEETRYFGFDETKPIAVKDGFVTFTMHFKYLGSFISYNLRDDFDIDTRIKKAGMAMGALRHFFNNKHVDTYTKHLIFKAIPLNLLLWGCEAWSLREEHYIKLESFLQRSIRNILNITMTQVQEDHIKREHIREMFYGIADIRTTIAARQLSFVGKAVRNNIPGLPTRLMITACCNHERVPGRPQLHNKDTLCNNLVLLFERVEYVTIDAKGSLKDWIKYAQDAPIWKDLIRCMLDPRRKIPDRPNWESRNSSNTGANSQSNQSSQRQDQSGPRQERTGRRPPPRARRDEEPTNRQWNPEGVGRNLFDSFGVLGLGFGATEMDVKTAYRMLALRYHPDKNDPEITGMNRDQATAHFQLLNTANSYLRSVL